jgi:hypothetical protein
MGKTGISPALSPPALDGVQVAATVRVGVVGHPTGGRSGVPDGDDPADGDSLVHLVEVHGQSKVLDEAARTQWLILVVRRRQAQVTVSHSVG